MLKAGVPMPLMSGSDCEPLHCSFCGRSQAAVGKLFSSPSGSPRAYICDECVAVCAAVIGDGRQDSPAAAAGALAWEEPHPLLGHPMASELMASIAHWIRQESLGHDASEELARIRSIAAQMIASGSGSTL